MKESEKKTFKFGRISLSLMIDFATDAMRCDAMNEGMYELIIARCLNTILGRCLMILAFECKKKQRGFFCLFV